MNKKITKSIALAIIMVMALLALAGCGETTNNTDENELEGLAVYTQDEDMADYTKCEEMEGIEFYYPSNYASVGKATQPMYMDPDILGASVNLVSSEYSDALTFEGFIDASILGIKGEMDVEGEVEKEYISLNGKKAAKLTYITTSEGERLTLTQIVLVKNNQAYILTLGALEKDVTKFEPKMDKIIKSFK